MGRGEMASSSHQMSPEFLEEIVAKARSECRPMVFALSSWTEPLLHKNLDRMIRVVKRAGIDCWFSTNLNRRDMDIHRWHSILMQRPDVINVSVSGYSQEVYSIGHYGGNAELVWKNLRELCKASQRYLHRTRINVVYHLYKHSAVPKELEMARHEALSAGATFYADYAKVLPLERAVRRLQNQFLPDEHNHPRYVAEDWLLLPVAEAARKMRWWKWLPCSFQHRELSLDSYGTVTLCCSLAAPRFNLVPYLQTPLSTIEKLKFSHPYCRVCKQVGGHTYMMSAITLRRKLYLLGAHLYCKTLGRFFGRPKFPAIDADKSRRKTRNTR